MTTPLKHERHPERISWLRACLVALVSLLATYAMTAFAFLVDPTEPEVFDEMIGWVIAVATIVPIVVSLPITIILQRERIKLAKALRQLAEAHNELERRARTDALTLLLNREALFREIARTRENAPSGAMLMIDIDHFKPINDIYGHEAGDKALRQVALTISECLRPVDCTGRIGGEEFGAFLPCDSASLARHIAERVRHAVSELVFHPHPDVVQHITVSIGLAMAGPEDNLDDLMRQADSSLYSAKEAGRNRVVIHDAVQATLPSLAPPA